jgi:protein SCO1/2
MFVGTLMGSASLVALVTLWLTVPRFWPVAQAASIERAVETGTGPAFWWPPSWRAEFHERTTASRLLNLSFSVVRGDDLLVLSDVLSVLAMPTSSDSNAPESSASERLAVIRTAPNFELTDQSGQTLSLADLKGKVLLVSFIFTTCNGSCPATTHRMSLVQQELKSRGLLKDGRVRLVSITLDPARDTPDVLARYMRLYDADPERWSFLTGPVEEVQKTIAAWDMWVRPAANGQLDHPSRIFLVDPKCRVREIYNLSFLKPAWAADDVKLLLDENLPSPRDP